MGFCSSVTATSPNSFDTAETDPECNAQMLHDRRSAKVMKSHALFAKLIDSP